MNKNHCSTWHKAKLHNDMLILKVSGSRKEVFWKTRKHIVLQIESWAEIKRPKDQKEGRWASVKALKQEAALSIMGAKRMPGAGKLYTHKKKTHEARCAWRIRLRRDPQSLSCLLHNDRDHLKVITLIRNSN